MISKNFTRFAQDCGGYIQGEIQNDIEYAFCKSVNVKKFNRVLFDGYANEDSIVIVPAGKALSDLALIGALVAGPVVGLAALGSLVAGQAAIGALKKKSIEEIVSGCAVIFENNTCAISATETKMSLIGFGRRNWNSSIRLSGPATFNGIYKNVTIDLVMDDRISKISKKNALLDLCSIIKIPAPQVIRR